MPVYILAVLFLLVAVPVQAQTLLKAPLSSARLAWDAGQGADKHVVQCGAVTREVLMPETSVAVRDLVPGPGIYDCTIYAENAFARQVEPNVPFPQFEAGNAAGAPTRARIEVQ